MKKFQTKQEDFWSGSFGNNYIARNDSEELIAGNIALFSKILDKTKGIKSILELGANIGLNLIAIKSLFPNAKFSAVEINQTAANLLKANKFINVYQKSILDFKSSKKFDFIFTKTVLIHINPVKLNKVYEILYKCSNKYICVAEYYNPTPLEIEYRGINGYLFKRDFAGEILDKYRDLELIDYGFAYKRDNNFTNIFGDINWFLMKKK